MGIRSERLLAGKTEKNTFLAQVDVIEILGKEKLLNCKLSDESDIVISVPGHYEYEVDEFHNFHFDLEALHFFDSDTSERIN